MVFWCGGWDGFVCLWLSSSGTEAFFWTRPHMIRPAHAALISSLVRFIPAPWRLSASRHTQTWRKMFISVLRGWGGGVAHSTFQFIKQFVCDYVNVPRLIWHLESTPALISRSLIHARPRRRRTVLTAEAYDDMWAVALKFLTHTHTHTSQSYSGFFFTRHCRKWERKKMCTFLLLHNQSRKVAAVSSIFLYSFNIYCCFSGWATHTSNHKHWCQLL